MNETALKWLTYGIWAAVGMSVIGFAIVCYWRFISPIPNIVVYENYIRDLDDDEEANAPVPTLHRPGVFQVTRRIKSSASAETHIFVFFETPQNTTPEEMRQEAREETGQNPRPSKISFQVAEVIEHIEKGEHWRSRVYETPRVLPPGDYIYRSVERYCNPIRCEDYHLPPIPVRLAGPPGPER